jgi:hypothetical protein
MNIETHDIEPVLKAIAARVYLIESHLARGQVNEARPLLAQLKRALPVPDRANLEAAADVVGCRG